MNFKKVVSNKSCKKALARDNRLATTKKEMKESRRAQEVARSKARDNKNYYSCLEVDEDLAVQAEETVSLQLHGIGTNWFNQAKYHQKKAVLKNLDDHIELQRIKKEYYACVDVKHEFNALEKFGPWREAYDLGQRWKAEEHEALTQQFYEHFQAWTEYYKSREIGRFIALREKELRAINFGDAHMMESMLVQEGTYAQADQFITNVLTDYYEACGRCVSRKSLVKRRFDPVYEDYNREDVSQYLGPYGDRYFYLRCKKSRRSFIRRTRWRIKHYMDRDAFEEAERFNKQWHEDDTLECVSLLFVQPIVLSVQGEEEEEKLSLEEELADMSARERMRFLEATYGSAPQESVEQFAELDPLSAPAEGSMGRTLMNSFEEALKTLTGDTKSFVLRAMDVCTALYNLTLATDKKSFFSLLYSAIRTIFKDMNGENVVAFGKKLMCRLSVQAGAKEIWRYIADALSVMWEGVGTWIACPMVDVVLDLINLLAFCGIVPSTTLDLLDNPKYKFFARKVKREVSGISDLIGIVIKSCMMAAGVVAMYLENGILDLYGWSIGSKKEVFADHAALMSERVEAAYGLLKSNRRAPKTRFKCPTQYTECLDKTIDTCTYEMSKSRNIGEKNIYARMMKELMTVRNEVNMALRCQEARVKPFTFSVYGATSSMKSNVATAVWKAIAHENGLVHDSTNFATVNFKDEYFSEVHQQEILIMDDFMNEKDTSALKVNPIRILLDWSSNNTVQIPGAAIHEKGVKFCRAKVLGMTCHDREFHAHTMSYQPEAAYRRVEVYIETIMKPQYRNENGQPSHEKIKADFGPDACFPDIWYFNVWVCQIEGTGWKWVGVGKELMNNAEMEETVRNMSRKHFEVQESIVKKLNNPGGWFCPHDKLTGACALCQAVHVQSKETEEVAPEKVELGRIREMMRCATGAQSEKLMALLYPELIKFESMSELRARVNRCAGECLQSVIVGDDDDAIRIDITEFVRLFRSKEPFIDGPEPIEIPCEALKDAPLLGVQAQCFEMDETLFYEVITWEELEAIYPEGTRADILLQHQRKIERQYTVDDVFVTTVFDVYHFEVVYTIRRSWLNVQGEEEISDFAEGRAGPPGFEYTPTPRAVPDPPPLPGLEPSLTCKSDLIREHLREVYQLGYGLPVPRDPIGRFRRHAARTSVDLTITKDTKKVYYSWFFWQLFSSLKGFILGSFALWMFFPSLCSAAFTAWTYYRRFGWRCVWRLPGIFLYTLYLEWKGVSRFLNWGDALSNWLDDKWMPANTRYAISIQRAYEAGGAVGAAAAVVSARVRPVSALEIHLGKTRAIIIKSALNIAGYVAAAAAAFALYRMYRAFKPIPLLGSGAKTAAKNTVGKVEAGEWIITRFGGPAKSEEMRDLINKIMDEETIEDEHFYFIPKERMKELIVNSSEVDYPIAEKGEHAGGWVTVNPGKNHIGAKAKSTHPDVLRAQLETNLRFCTISCVHEGKRKVFRVHALAISGCDWIIPSHVILPDVEDYEFTALVDDKTVAAPHIKGTFSAKYVEELEGVDFSIVRLVGSLPMTNITKFFPIEEKADVYAQFFYRDNGDLKCSTHRRMPLSTIQSVQNRGTHYKQMNVCMMQQYPIPTYQGLCGAVWMGGTEREPFIHSMHICGMEDAPVGGSSVVTIGMLNTAFTRLNARVPQVVSSGPFPLEIQARQWEHTLNPRHFLNFIPEVEGEVPILDLVGTHEGHSGKYSQDIRESLIAPALRHRLDWPIVHQPVPHPNSSRHYQHAMEELAYPRNEFVASIMDKAVEDFTAKIVDHVSSIPKLFDMVRPLPDTAIVSGIDAMVGIDKMNPNTSAGFPERGKKGRFFVPGDPDAPTTVPMTMDDEHLALANAMENKLASGERVYAPFTLSVKIEPVKITKEYARLFGASNMVFTFVFRKYYLSIFRLIQMQPFHFETALGINCHSSDWDQMAKFMEHHDRLIEGDYQTYDKTMGASVIIHAFSVLIEIAKIAGYTERQLMIMRGIATEVAYPTYEARGVLFIAGGSNPSGHPGTFIINCFANSLFMRYAFYWGMKQHGVPLSLSFEKRFDDFVNLVTAGDDHLAGVSPECTWFDQYVVQAAMASVRVGYTDGKKNHVFASPFTNILEASFVSRGFRKCSYLKRWVAPLAIKSLQKSYMIHNFGDKCPYTPSELIALVVEQNEVELFFHGEEQFQYYYNAVRGAMEDAGLSSWLQPLTTWEQVGELVNERTKPAFYPDLTTQSSWIEDDEPPKKRSKYNHVCVIKTINGKMSICIRNSFGQITWRGPSDGPPPSIQAFTFATTTGSLSMLYGKIGEILATQSNSNNGMVGSATVMHDNPSALTWSSSRGAMPDASRELYSSGADGLSSYLERPILIAQVEWGQGVTLYQSFFPLTKYLTSVPIVRKLQNFQNMMFEMEIDFEVSANPFLYGMLLVNWVPFPKYDSLLRDRGLIYADNVEASQRQHLFIDASSSAGGTLKIPFYWPTEYFNLVKDNPDDFGYLSIRQLNPLMHVSGANQTVTVYIRAKLVNIKLHTSTTQLVGAQRSMSVQAKDESPDDKLSSVATRVAKVAGSLTPVLGGYAIATEQAAGAAAGILRAMGLSHPRSKEMVHRFENRPLGNMSNYNVPSSAYTLGIDENNEVTVDSGVACMSEDEMSLPFILGKETFIGTYDWDITNQAGDVLASHVVHPYQYMKVTGVEEWHCSPMAFMARMFTYWTGTIKFRFQIVCSKWHRGRLRIIHDPVLMGVVDATTWQTNLQSVVDITDERDFTIEVKYVQGQLWSATGPLRTGNPSFKVGFDYDSTELKETNGVLKVVVMNKLVIPDDTISAPCHINVFASAGMDFELAVPKNNLSNFSINQPVVVVAQSIAATAPEAAFVTTGPAGSFAFDSTLNRMVYSALLAPVANGYEAPFYFTEGTSQTGTITLRNTGSTALNVAANSNGTASIANIPAGGTGDVIIRSSPTTATGTGSLGFTLSHDGTGNVLFRIEAASLPVVPGYRYQSVVSNDRVLRRDGQQDATGNPSPPPTWPVFFNLGGAPTVYWRSTGATGLYQAGNNGAPVRMLTSGPVRVNDGIYGPTRATSNHATPKIWYNTPDQGGGYSNTTFQLSADFAASTTVRGVVYDVMFLVPALTTQAEEVQDAEIGDPSGTPTQAVIHDASTPEKYPFVYFGEKIIHVRQILGRPEYHTTYALGQGATNALRRHRIKETNIPEYPTVSTTFTAAWTPLYFIMACYNGWRGSFRSKYIINTNATNMPCFAQLERLDVGESARVQSFSELTDIRTAVGLTQAIVTRRPLWNGAIITNPQLANELNAEFPYYYRYRFRSARPSQMGGRSTSTDSHELTVDMLNATGPVYVDRYFQPGDDFTLLNWMGTPVLY